MWWILLFSIASALFLTSVFFMLRSMNLKRQLEDTKSQLNTIQNDWNPSAIQQASQTLNPHLFKNALNAIQSHAYQTYYAMDKVAGVLDYVLYDSKKNLVTLNQELNFAFNLIDMNRIKLSPLFDLTIKNMLENDSEINHQLLLPLCTVDLIENSFKHSDFQANNSFITIHFFKDKNRFNLEVSNRISSHQALQQEKGGTGLARLKDRLSAAYGENYTLNIASENTIFTALLSLPLIEQHVE